MRPRGPRAIHGPAVLVAPLTRAPYQRPGSRSRAARSGGSSGRPWNETVLSCTDLRKRFGDVQAVDGISFRIGAGETYGLLGPNGAGKTTTISMVVRAARARRRRASTVAGAPLTTRSVAAKAAIGYVPQDLAIYPDLSGAREPALLRAALRHRGRRRRAQRVDEVLDVIGLAERGDDQAKTYSGGMKRRLNIGIGLLHRPRLLVLDEPTVGVDPQSRNAILESVERLAGGGDGRPLHDALHGGGRAPLRPDRDRRPRRARRPRARARARRARRPARPGAAPGRRATWRRAPRACAALAAVRAASVRDGGLELIVDDARERARRSCCRPRPPRRRPSTASRSTSPTSRPSSSTSPARRCGTERAHRPPDRGQGPAPAAPRPLGDPARASSSRSCSRRSSA